MIAMSKGEADACTEESLAYDDAPQESRPPGRCPRALQPVEAATTVRVRTASSLPTARRRNERTAGGFILIEARDLNEAIQVAAKIPPGPAWQHRGTTDSERSGPEEKFMKFMSAIYHDENVLDALPKGEMQALIDSAPRLRR